MWRLFSCTSTSDSSFSRLSAPPAGAKPISSQKSQCSSWPPGAWAQSRKLTEDLFLHRNGSYDQSLTREGGKDASDRNKKGKNFLFWASSGWCEKRPVLEMKWQLGADSFSLLLNLTVYFKSFFQERKSFCKEMNVDSVGRVKTIQTYVQVPVSPVSCCCVYLFPLRNCSDHPIQSHRALCGQHQGIVALTLKTKTTTVRLISSKTN